MSKGWPPLALSGLGPSWALAQDGRGQIDQSIVAANGTNRPTKGFPDAITQPGSYQLSGNLVVPENFSSSPGPVSNALRGFSVSNGTIKGTGNIGIIVGASAQIRNVIASSNGGYGIAKHSGSTVLGTANGNGNIGFFVGTGNVVSNNTALSNNAVGTEVFGGEALSVTKPEHQGV
jgi:hypothetical protein